MNSGEAADLSAELAKGLLALGLTLEESQKKSLLAYLGLMQKWGKVYNLTALRQPHEMLTHHLLDSLAVVQPLRQQIQSRPGLKPGASLLDVGTGAGLPGVVIAICCPELAVTCVDAVAKKIAFIQQVALLLALPNLVGVHARVETLEGKFDVISSRAFSSLADFVALSSSALAPEGFWLAMKGLKPVEEMKQLTQSVDVFHVEQIRVPGLDASRCIVWMREAASEAAGS